MKKVSKNSALLRRKLLIKREAIGALTRRELGGVNAGMVMGTEPPFSNEGVDYSD